MKEVKQALIYARVSTDEQAEEGQSIDTQIKLCQKWARENGFTIGGIYKDEGRSATNLNRPALKELLLRCQEKNHDISAILVQDTDRWCRSTLDHLTTKSILEKAGIQLISISQPLIDNSPEGNLVDTVIASVNAFQSQITGRKVSKVMEQKARSGIWPGWAPLGFINTEAPSPSSNLDKRIVIPDPDRASYITLAFELYSTGNFSVKALRDKLHKMGLRSKSGNKVQVSVLLNTLKNPFYTGKMLWRGEILQGKHEPLTTPDIFERCQEVMAIHNQNACRRRKHSYLLRGYVFCACGRRMWAEKHVKKNGLNFDHYYCKSCGKGSYVNTDSLENQIEKRFEAIQITKEYAQEILDTAKQILEEFRQSSQDESQILLNRKAKIEARMREAENNLLDKTIDKETFRGIYDRLREELDGVMNGLARINQDHSKTLEAVERLVDLAENIGNAYKQARFELKRHYLNIFFSKFLVNEGRVVEAIPSQLLQPLLGSKVRVRPNWLPGLDSNQKPNA